MMMSHRMCRYILFVLLLAAGPGAVHAQFFTSGQDPASLRWQQIQADHFQVIFPEGFEDKAQYVTNILEHAYGLAGRSLDHKPRNISVIIHNQSVISNGFVAPAPHRMELYSVPPQDNLDNPWLEHLAIHEFRHVVQIDKLHQGLTKVLGYVFGEQANAVVAGIIPMWYFEGDAVIAETALTQNGRGRLPSFSRNIRARLADSVPLFSFDKMLLGSYKDYTPNHYELGYHIASFGRKKYGAGLWQDVEDHVAHRPWQLFSFNLGLNRFSGQYIEGLYDSAMTWFEDYYYSADAVSNASGRLLAGEGHYDYVSYRFPVRLEGDDLLALKKDYSRLPRFVRIGPSGEKVVHVPGPMTFEGFSYASGMIAWSERIPDPRWSNRNYSVVKVYDMSRKKARVLSWKKRWFAPDLSGNARRVVAAKVGVNNEFSLVVVATANGQVVKEWKHPSGIFLQQPVWSVNDESIFVIGGTTKGKGIYRVDYQTGSWETILEPGYREINHLSAGQDHLFFRAAVDNKEQIVALNLKNDQLQRVTSAPVNAGDVSWSPGNNEILYAGYQANGYNIRRLRLDQNDFESLEATENTENNTDLAARLARQEDSLFHSAPVPRNDYAVQPYRKWKNLLHFHSWAPFYMDYNVNNPAISDVAPGVTLFSQNLLSTALATLGYSYSDDAHHLHTNITYKGWYPVFNLSGVYGGKPGIVKPPSVSWTPELVNDYTRWDATVSLPLNLSRGRNITGINPSVSYEFDRTYYHNYQENYYTRGLQTIDYGLWFYTYQRMAYRDLVPRWGLTFDLNHRSSPFSESILGNMFSMEARGYVPGLVEDHGISLALGYQNQEPDKYLYTSYLDFPRGFEPRTSEELVTFESEYLFPLAYPDWNIPSLIYVKRLKAAGFFDYAWNRRRMMQNNRIVWDREQLYSVGAEITSDFHLARVMFPLSAGVRYSYMPQFSDHRFEFIFNVDFYRIYSKLFE